MFPEGEKKISGGLIFQDRGLEATKRLQILQISDVGEMHSRFNLSRSKLWSMNSSGMFDLNQLDLNQWFKSMI